MAMGCADQTDQTDQTLKETKSESLEVVNWRIRRLHYNHHVRSLSWAVRGALYSIEWFYLSGWTWRFCLQIICIMLYRQPPSRSF